MSKPSSAAACAACGAPLSAGARFCHRCGTPVGARPQAPAAATNILPWSIAAVSLIVVISLLATRSWQAEPAAAPTGGDGVVAPFANGGGGGAPPDISQMSPEERADRLYNRIMTYAERGAVDSAAFFAPMAMMAYQAIGELSADQRYHVGSIGLATGTPDGAQAALAQADSIRRQAPDHLLGLMLAIRSNEVLGNAAKQRELTKRFLSVLDAELKKPIDEYAAHRPSIDAATKAFREGR